MGLRLMVISWGWSRLGTFGLDWAGVGDTGKLRWPSISESVTKFRSYYRDKIGFLNFEPLSSHNVQGNHICHCENLPWPSGRPDHNKTPQQIRPECFQVPRMRKQRQMLKVDCTGWRPLARPAKYLETVLFKRLALMHIRGGKEGGVWPTRCDTRLVWQT